MGHPCSCPPPSRDGTTSLLRDYYYGTTDLTVSPPPPSVYLVFGLSLLPPRAMRRGKRCGNVKTSTLTSTFMPLIAQESAPDVSLADRQYASGRFSMPPLDYISYLRSNTTFLVRTSVHFPTLFYSVFISNWLHANFASGCYQKSQN